MELDRGRLARHGVSALAACFAVGALAENLVSPSVTLGARTYDRGPEAVIVVVLVGIAAFVADRVQVVVYAYEHGLAKPGA